MNNVIAECWQFHKLVSADKDLHVICNVLNFPCIKHLVAKSQQEKRRNDDRAEYSRKTLRPRIGHVDLDRRDGLWLQLQQLEEEEGIPNYTPIVSEYLLVEYISCVRSVQIIWKIKFKWSENMKMMNIDVFSANSETKRNLIIIKESGIINVCNMCAYLWN